MEDASQKARRADRYQEAEDDTNPASLSLYFLPISLNIALLSTFSFFCIVCISPLTLPVPLSFTLSLSVTTVIFPLTRSDYTQPPLAITFYFKSTQPPDLPRFRLLFGSTVVIKMLPGSSSLLSKVCFQAHHAMAIQHFSPAFPSPLPTHFLIPLFFSLSPLCPPCAYCFLLLIMLFFFCLHLSHSPASSGCLNSCTINTSRH